MIVDKTGNLIWFQALPGIRAATDVRVQQYRGKPVITYWEGTSRQGIGVGDGLFQKAGILRAAKPVRDGQTDVSLAHRLAQHCVSCSVCDSGYLRI